MNKMKKTFKTPHSRRKKRSILKSGLVSSLSLKRNGHPQTNNKKNSGYTQNGISIKSKSQLTSKEQENRFKLLLENSASVIYEFDVSKGKYTYISPSCKEVLGIKSEDFLKMSYGSIASHVDKEDSHMIKKHMREIVTVRGKRRKNFHIEYRFHMASGEVKWLSNNHSVVYNSKGKASLIIGNITDISYRKDAQEELRKSYELQSGYLKLLTSIQNSLPAHIAMLDAGGNIIAVNESWSKFNEANALVQSAYSIGMNYLEICKSLKDERSVNAEAAASGIKKVLKGKLSQYILEYSCRPPQGNRWFRLTATPINRLKTEGAVVMHLEVTDRKLAELAVKESEAKYRLLFERSPLPMWVYDFDTLNILAVNKAAVRHYGYSGEEFLQLTTKDLIAEDEHWQYDDLREKIKKNGLAYISFFAGVWKHKKKNGEYIKVETTRSPIVFQGKKAILILSNDVTDKIKAEESLKQKSQEISALYEAERKLSSTLDVNVLYDKLRSSKKSYSCRFGYRSLLSRKMKS